ncbi:MAG: NrfD/PsrC family molybdoenzyme membrane anchor subunit [Bryobacteraceae bacterium]|nr:NrfD/PsrC family molybdoenzyme membrane anchor subunit [Bryobacteraceae bacterium]
MDSALIARSVRRCSFGRFALWLAPWLGVLGVGAWALWLCLRYGLYQTNMDNRYVFGLWIFLDLSIIALGAGAFFTGFLLYVMKKRELKAVIGSAVVLGFICYSAAMALLAVDVGQPLRAWFTYWHPNAHSMLTEVTFCITCYLTVLLIEYVPVILKTRKLRQIPAYAVFEWELHKLVPVFALIGTLLSFFHQGSLGGLFGVLRGRPFAFREGFALWPSTFFLFILSAAAVGPSFILLTTWTVEKLTGRRLVKDDVYRLLCKVSGWLLLTYVGAKAVDTMIWINATAPRAGFEAYNFYLQKPFGPGTLMVEVLLLGLLPALLLLRGAKEGGLAMINGAALACAGIVLNRFVMTIQTLALPTLPFDRFLWYVPSWQENAAFGAMLAYGVIVYSFSYRYLILFPQEKELSRHVS